MSLALVRDDDAFIYIVYPQPETIEPWVAENVIPVVESVPPMAPMTLVQSTKEAAHVIANFLRGDDFPIIYTDWPDDVKYFCQSIITGPGEMANIPRVVFDIIRVDAYPTELEGAVQHNALWDAMALKKLLTDARNS